MILCTQFGWESSGVGTWGMPLLSMNLAFPREDWHHLQAFPGSDIILLTGQPFFKKNLPLLLARSSNCAFFPKLIFTAQ